MSCAMTALLLGAVLFRARSPNRPPRQRLKPPPCTPRCGPTVEHPSYGDEGIEERITQLLGAMSLEEKVGQIDPGRHRQRHARRRAQVPARLGAQWRQFRARRRRPRAGERLARSSPTNSMKPRWTRAGSARDSDHLGRRCGARPQQHHRRDAVPAQRRPRRDAQSRADPPHRRSHRAGSARDRAGMDLRADHRRGAGRALGSRLRVVFRGSGDRPHYAAAMVDGPAGRSRVGRLPARRSRHRHRQALRRRRRHVRRPRPGRRPRQRGRAARRPRAGYTAARSAPACSP